MSKASACALQRVAHSACWAHMRIKHLPQPALTRRGEGVSANTSRLPSYFIEWTNFYSNIHHTAAVLYFDIYSQRHAPLCSQCVMRSQQSNTGSKTSWFLFRVTTWTKVVYLKPSTTIPHWILSFYSLQAVILTLQLTSPTSWGISLPSLCLYFFPPLVETSRSSLEALCYNSKKCPAINISYERTSPVTKSSCREGLMLPERLVKGRYRIFGW